MQDQISLFNYFLDPNPCGLHQSIISTSLCQALSYFSLFRFYNFLAIGLPSDCSTKLSLFDLNFQTFRSSGSFSVYHTYLASVKLYSNFLSARFSGFLMDPFTLRLLGPSQFTISASLCQALSHFSLFHFSGSLMSTLIWILLLIFSTFLVYHTGFYLSTTLFADFQSFLILRNPTQLSLFV